jgi:hypothetical protein
MKQRLYAAAGLQCRDVLALQQEGGERVYSHDLHASSLFMP